MGNIMLGVFKGLTIGGLGIWALFDYAVIMVNSFQMRNEIDSFGFQAEFSKHGSLDAAYWIFAAAVFISVCLCVYPCIVVGKKKEDSVPKDPEAPLQPESQSENVASQRMPPRNFAPYR